MSSPISFATGRPYTASPYASQDVLRKQGQEASKNFWTVNSSEFWYLIGYFLDARDDGTLNLKGRKEVIALCANLADPASVPLAITNKYTS